MRMISLPRVLAATACIITLFAARGTAQTSNYKSVSDDEITEHIFSLAREYFREFQHPETGVLYGSRLSGRGSWTSPADILAEKPKPWGYGSRVADTVLHTGHMLVALLDAHTSRPDPFLEKQIRIHFEALKWIGSLPETHPKAGKPELSGLVPRGPHPDDPSAYFDDSSMDQHTTYIISLALFSKSKLATEADKAWIRESLGKVGRRLERHDWSIVRADGKTQAHVGFSWKGFNSSHASILLPSVLALHQGTGDDHWSELYETFLTENEGKRWEQVKPGPQVKINGHPIYANQNAFRVHAWYQLETNPERRKVIGGLLKQSVNMQLSREFPGEFYRKFHSAEVWKEVEEAFSWGGPNLKGALPAWKSFKTEILEQDHAGLAALAHVRFPLGGFHMALLSESPDLIDSNALHSWDMLTSVDLKNISAGETHYLFSVVGLHLYARHFKDEKPSAETFGPSLPQIDVAGIGPVMDVAIENQHAFAIGQGALHILDISNTDQPAVLGKLSGLGSVRQIVVKDGVAYVTSRQDGLFIIDATDPEKPRLLNHYDTVEFATGVAISGDILFVACRHYGVELVDVSDPENPRHLSTVRTGEAQSVTSRNGILYAGVWASSEVVSVDIQDPYFPEILSKVPLDGYGDGVAVSGNFLYAATGHHSGERPRKNPGDPGFGKGHGLEVFDLSDPGNPKYVSRIKFPPLYEIGNDMWSVTISNGHAFVADTYNGLFVVDIRDPENLRFAGRHQLPLVESRKTNGFVGGLALAKDRVFLAGGFTDLHVIQAKDMAALADEDPGKAPVLKEAPEPRGDELWKAYRPGAQVYAAELLSDSVAVVACGSAGVHLVDFAEEPFPISKYPTTGFATDVSVSDKHIFVAESAGGLTILEIPEEGENLKAISRFEVPGKAIRQVEISKDGVHAMLQVGANQFYIVDVSDPVSPRQVLKDARHGLLYGDQMMRGQIDDRYACVFWHVSGFHWFDLLASPAPVFSGNNYPERTGSSNGMTIFQGKTLATVRGGFLLLDLEETRPVKELPPHQIEGIRDHLGVPTVSGNTLYAAHRASGILTVVDISDLENPRLVKRIQTPGNPGRVSSTNDKVLVPNGYSGLLILNR